MMVAGPRAQDIESVCQSPESHSLRRIVVGMIHLETIETMGRHHLGEHVLGQYLCARATPRVGNHGQAACGVDQFDAGVKIGVIAPHIGGAALREETIERLLSICDMTRHHQRIRYVWSAD